MEVKNIRKEQKDWMLFLCGRQIDFRYNRSIGKYMIYLYIKRSCCIEKYEVIFMQFINKIILQIAMQQSAVDSNCRAEDFLKDENIIVTSAENPNARKYLTLPFECNLISYGNNVVATINEKYCYIVSEYINYFLVEHCFEMPNLCVLNDAMWRENLRVSFMEGYFLQNVDELKILYCPYRLKVLHSWEFDMLYTDA